MVAEGIYEVAYLSFLASIVYFCGYIGVAFVGVCLCIEEIYLMVFCVGI